MLNICLLSSCLDKAGFPGWTRAALWDPTLHTASPWIAMLAWWLHNHPHTIWWIVQQVNYRTCLSTERWQSFWCSFHTHGILICFKFICSICDLETVLSSLWKGIIWACPTFDAKTVCFTHDKNCIITPSWCTKYSAYISPVLCYYLESWKVL